MLARTEVLSAMSDYAFPTFFQQRNFVDKSKRRDTRRTDCLVLSFTSSKACTKTRRDGCKVTVALGARHSPGDIGGLKPRERKRDTGDRRSERFRVDPCPIETGGKRM
jgi:hypothetical protein